MNFWQMANADISLVLTCDVTNSWFKLLKKLCFIRGGTVINYSHLQHTL